MVNRIAQFLKTPRDEGVAVRIDSEEVEFPNGIWTLTAPSMGDNAVWYLEDMGCVSTLLFNSEEEAEKAVITLKVNGMAPALSISLFDFFRTTTRRDNVAFSKSCQEAILGMIHCPTLQPNCSSSGVI